MRFSLVEEHDRSKHLLIQGRAGVADHPARVRPELEQDGRPLHRTSVLMPAERVGPRGSVSEAGRGQLGDGTRAEALLEVGPVARVLLLRRQAAEARNLEVELLAVRGTNADDVRRVLSLRGACRIAELDTETGEARPIRSQLSCSRGAALRSSRTARSDARPRCPPLLRGSPPRSSRSRRSLPSPSRTARLSRLSRRRAPGPTSRAAAVRAGRR